MSYHDQQYMQLAEHVLLNGVEKGDRTGTGTISVFDYTMRFDLSDGTIPLLTTKKMFTRMCVRELLWYVAGDTNIKYLVDNNVPIWTEWPCVAWLKQTNQVVPHLSTSEWKEVLAEFTERIKTDNEFALHYGDLGPVYGKQWRAWDNIIGTKLDDTQDPMVPVLINEPVDQLTEVINTINNNPNCRRMIVNSWSVGQLDDMVLPPCHYNFQFHTAPMNKQERDELYFRSNTNEDFYSVTIEKQLEILNRAGVPTLHLSCKLTQRSADVGLGVPFNIVQYSMLVRMVAEVTGTHAKEFIWSGGDVHIYQNHIAQLKTQLRRNPAPSPTLDFARKIHNIDDFTFDDFVVTNYNPHGVIKMDVAV